jgi:antitoxin YefM
MQELSFRKFKVNIDSIVDQVIAENMPIRVKRRSGGDFIIVSASDWDREQETMFVLRNKSLMDQIAKSLVTHHNNSGFKPTEQQLNSLDDI